MYCWESYGKATDMWALGMVIFEMITGGNINIMRSAGATSAGLDVLGMHLRYHLDGLKWNKVRYTSSAVRALLQRSPYQRHAMVTGGDEFLCCVCVLDRGIVW